MNPSRVGQRHGQRGHDRPQPGGVGEHQAWECGPTDGMGEDMRIFTKAVTHDPAQTKPAIKAVSQPGQVRITVRDPQT